MAKKRVEVEAGSGDVFTDLGYADAKERRLKVCLALEVNQVLEKRGLPQAQAAKLRAPPAARVGPRSLPAQPVLGRAPDGISDPARQGRGDSDHPKARAKILIVGARASRRITAESMFPNVGKT